MKNTEMAIIGKTVSYPVLNRHRIGGFDTNFMTFLVIFMHFYARVWPTVWIKSEFKNSVKNCQNQGKNHMEINENATFT